MKTGLVPVADRGRGLLAQRGVRLVADDDRVGVGDVAGVADEPLVGLDRHRAVGAVLPAHQRRGDALRVAAVAQLAEELVDEVAAVGEDQDAAGARALDEAERGDRLAGAGRVLEPEALAGVGVLGRLGELLGVLGDRARPPSPAAPPARRRPRRRASSSPGMPTEASGASRRARSPPVAVRRAAVAGLGEQRGQRAGQRVDLVRGQHRAVDELAARPGRAAARARAAATSAGATRPTGPSRPRRARRARRRARARRAVPGASWAAASSPSSTNGSRVNVAARSIASSEGVTGVASTATGVESAMTARVTGEWEPLTQLQRRTPRCAGEIRSGLVVTGNLAEVGAPRVHSIEADRASAAPTICHRMRREARCSLGSSAFVILTAVLVIGLSQAGCKPAATAAPAKPVRPAGVACASCEGAPAPLASLHDQCRPAARRRRARVRGAAGRTQGPARRDQQVGVVVRPVPRRVPVLPAGRHRARQGGRVPRRQRRRQHAARASASSSSSRCRSRPTSTRTEKIARAIKAAGELPHHRVRRREGQDAFIHQGGYRSADAARARTSTKYPEA